MVCFDLQKCLTPQFMDAKRFAIGSKTVSLAGTLYILVIAIGIVAVAASAFLVSAIGFLIACMVTAYALLKLLKMPEPLVEDRLL